jgi:hypothetical protein
MSGVRVTITLSLPHDHVDSKYANCGTGQSIEWLRAMVCGNEDYCSKIVGLAFYYDDVSETSLEFLKNIPNLKVLAVFGMNVITIPPVVWELTSLDELYYDFTTIERIPVEITQLPNLKYFSGPVKIYAEISMEFRYDVPRIQNYCRTRLWRRELACYAFLALACPQLVIEALDGVLADLFYHRSFA